MSGSSDALVHLLPGPRGGLTVPLQPYLLAIDLEARGFTLTPNAGDTLTVVPYSQLTPDDCAQIRRWKLHLLALLRYEPPGVN